MCMPAKKIFKGKGISAWQSAVTGWFGCGVHRKKRVFSACRNDVLIFDTGIIKLYNIAAVLCAKTRQKKKRNKKEKEHKKRKGRKQK